MSTYLINEVGPVRISRTGIKREAAIQRAKRNTLRDVLRKATHVIINYLREKSKLLQKQSNQSMIFSKQDIINILQDVKIALGTKYMPILLSNVEIGYNTSCPDMKCVRHGGKQLDIAPKQ